MAGQDFELGPRELLGAGFLLFYGYHLFGDGGLGEISQMDVLVAVVGLVAVYGVAAGSERVLDRVYDSPTPEIPHTECRTCGRDVKENAAVCSHCNTREPGRSADEWE